MNSDYEIIDTRILYLNSASRVDLTEPIYDCNYIVEPFIFDVQNDEYLEIQFTSFICKYSFYNIDTDRNSEVFVSINNGSSFSSKLSLPRGNFNVKELATNIQTLLRGETGDTIEVSWNKPQNKYKYTEDVVSLNNIVLKFPENETGYELYGFAKSDMTLNGDGTRQVNIGAKVDTDFFSPSVVSIGNEEALYISTDLTSAENYQLREDAQRQNEIAAKVFIIAPPSSYIYYVASDYTLYTNHYPLGVSPKNKFRIRLTDEVLNPIKLPTDYQMQFRIIKRKKHNEVQKLLGNILKLQATNLMKKN